MAVVPPSAALVQQLSVSNVQITSSLLVLLLLTVAVYATIYAYQPPIPQTMGIGFVPWVMVGSLLTVLGGTGAYPAYVKPFITPPGAHLLALFIPGLTWLAILNLSVSRQRAPPYHHYLGAMGTGAMTILWATLILRNGTGILSEFAVIFVLADLAILATGVLSLAVWFWSPDFIDYTPIVGGFAIFGALMNGIATTLAYVVEGATGHTAFSAATWEILTVVAPGGLGGVDFLHLWMGLFLMANAAIGVHIATHLAQYADRSPRAVNAMLATVGTAGFAIGFNRILLLVVG